jgi:hypothetical protein
MKTNPLANIRIASPCHADWAEMTGDERTRFCASCQKNVYNLSAMTAAQASNLIREKEGKLCVRYYLRRDGSILTQDCPVGLAAIRRQMFKIAAAFVSLLALAGFGCKKEEQPPLTGEPTLGSPVPVQIMGDVAAPPQTNNVAEIKGEVYLPPQTNELREIKGKMAAPPQPVVGRVAPLQTN